MCIYSHNIVSVLINIFNYENYYCRCWSLLIPSRIPTSFINIAINHLEKKWVNLSMNVYSTSGRYYVKRMNNISQFSILHITRIMNTNTSCAMLRYDAQHAASTLNLSLSNCGASTKSKRVYNYIIALWSFSIINVAVNLSDKFRLVNKYEYRVNMWMQSAYKWI